MAKDKYPFAEIKPITAAAKKYYKDKYRFLNGNIYGFNKLFNERIAELNQVK